MLLNRNFTHMVALISLVSGGIGTVRADMIEEVVVTAQKREQSIQDVTASVVAFSGEQIQPRVAGTPTTGFGL